MPILRTLSTAFRLGLYFYLSMVQPAHAASADPIQRACHGLLTQSPHLHDPLRVLDRSLHSLRFRDWMCRSGFHTRAELATAATGLNLPAPDLGILLGNLLPEQSPAFNEALASFCSSGYQLQTTPAMHEYFQRIATASMTDAYTACLQQIPDSVFGDDKVFIYAQPDSTALREFTLHAQWRRGSQPLALQIISTRGAVCRQQDADGIHCHKEAEPDAVVTLKTGPSTRQTITLPGYTSTALTRLTEQHLILGDRLRFLETALEQAGPEQAPIAVRTRGACPRGSYVSALEMQPASAKGRSAKAGLRLICRKLPPNTP